MMTTAAEFVVTLDGGAAAGKSSTSRELAHRFDLLHVDTGSHYRAMTHAMVAAGVSLTDEAAVAAALPHMDLGWQREGQTAQIALSGRVLTVRELRSDAVNAQVSQVAAIPAVRAFLRDFQRGFQRAAPEAGFAGLIMEGRDIGSVIFPDAPLRFFLVADEHTRILRRAAEGQQDAIAERDRRDSSRKTAPLICPEGAVSIDTSKLTLDEVVSELSSHLKRWLSARS
ncbi:MAG: (d)CMP kinase [Opitutales bacterium]